MTRTADDDGLERERQRSICHLRKIERLTGTPFEGFSQPHASMAALETIAEIVQLWVKITNDLERADILQRMRDAAARCARPETP